MSLLPAALARHLVAAVAAADVVAQAGVAVVAVERLQPVRYVLPVSLRT
jgi:hypothetical protein